MRVAPVVVTAAVLVAAVAAAGSIRAATRLDWLHVRTDAAWAALDAALCRRARAVRVLNGCAALHHAAEAASAFGAGSHCARRAAMAVREDVENELGQALAVLDRCGLESASAGRLLDAEQRAVISRRVYNDAVRDTLALRSRRMVRWLRLAGNAPLPRYFEVAEPALPSYGLELDGAGA